MFFTLKIRQFSRFFVLIWLRFISFILLKNYYYNMSSKRKQPVRHDSTSTNSSDEVRVNIRQHTLNSAGSSGTQGLAYSEIPSGYLSRQQMQLNILQSSDIKIGEHITNVYNNYYLKVKWPK